MKEWFLYSTYLTSNGRLCLLFRVCCGFLTRAAFWFASRTWFPNSASHFPPDRKKLPERRIKIGKRRAGAGSRCHQNRACNVNIFVFRRKIVSNCRKFCDRRTGRTIWWICNFSDSQTVGGTNGPKSNFRISLCFIFITTLWFLRVFPGLRWDWCCNSIVVAGEEMNL